MEMKTIKKNSPSVSGDNECGTCLYVSHDSESPENCLRFARFVDHALNETSRDCDYWTPAGGGAF
jgi:hypothetical protein